MYSGNSQVRKHHSKWLIGPDFATAQFLNRGFTPGIAGQEKPTQSLDRDDFSFLQQDDGRAERIFRWNRESMTVAKLQTRPAYGAGVGLSMEAPIERIVIFLLAPGAHVEFGHSRFGAIIGDILDDREPGAAIRTVGKRIPMAPVVGIEDLIPAGRTGRNVRRYQLILPLFFQALLDYEGAEAGRRKILEFQRFDA